jgi:hypothetical protein
MLKWGDLENKSLLSNGIGSGNRAPGCPNRFINVFIKESDRTIEYKSVYSPIMEAPSRKNATASFDGLARVAANENGCVLFCRCPSLDFFRTSRESENADGFLADERPAPPARAKK